MQPEILHPVLLVLISPAVGSFLNVLIDRLPRGENIALPGSACRRCSTRLGILDLIPILSFILTRGRCRYCGASIPPFHLYVEIAAVGLAVIAISSAAGLVDLYAGVVFLWLLLALAVTDLIWMRLPDLLTAALLVTGLVLSRDNLTYALISAGCGAGSFLAIRLAYQVVRGREGLGLGDVKLMAGIGAAVGALNLPLTVLLAAVSALAVALTRHLTAPGDQSHRISAASRLPFGAALSAATAAIWLVQGLQI